MEEIRPNYNSPKEYFATISNSSQRQYEALKAFFHEGLSAAEVASKFGYSITTVYTIAKRFKKRLKEKHGTDPFFITPHVGRKEKDDTGGIKKEIIILRKQYLSVTDIKTILDTKGLNVSERYITSIVKQEGFGRLPRRTKQNRDETISNVKDKVIAPKSNELIWELEDFYSHNAGLLCLWPLLKKFNLDKVIENSEYPFTKSINRLSSILCFLALKTSNVRRYSADDVWCMDRGLGLFAGLNVLPKAAWYSSYSDRVTPDMNLSFLRSLHKIWKDNNFLSDTINLDFTTIPYWGDDDSHLENNWSGKRRQSLSSMLAVLAQDPDSGIIDYGASNVRHDNEADVVLEFLDFYREGKKQDKNLKYLVFDSKFTNYQNLNKLNKRKIKFITIRKRGKNIVDRLENLPPKKWKKIHVMNANNKGRTLKVFEERVSLQGYEKKVRQIAITGHGKAKPALVITNDFKMETKDIIRKYCRRWIVEKGISEQIDFFHLNRVSSSMVIKVDFDLTMTIFAHNVYRLFALHLEEYSHLSDISIFEKFLDNGGFINISSNHISVNLKKKRNLPKILSVLQNFENIKENFFEDKKLVFTGATTS